ncbi:MAG: adenylate/guanylate cyclase protein, partial [Verrucomicrobiales bacterium]|nr:adenylate/guanylate cyclase protein [Verrucomicrobiales bacterium]
MLQKLQKHVQWVVAGGVLILVCLIEVLTTYFPSVNFLDRFESITYDWRVQYAARRAHDVSTNLGAIFIDDDTIKLLNEKLQFNYPLPRQVYGKVIRELTAQGAKGIGFDILFAELHAPSPNTDVIENGHTNTSDQFFVEQLRHSPAILAVMGQTSSNQWEALPPADLFRTNASNIGHIISEADKDNVLRRTLPFRMDPHLGRIWHMGIVLAAKQLQLDLDHPIITDNSITLNGPNGLVRTIPLDRSGAFLVNWVMEWNDPRLLKASLEDLMDFDTQRNDPNNKEPIPEKWKDKLVIIGSIGSGNNISDIGATAMSERTYLVCKHWNVANSIITNKFISIPPLWLDLSILIAMGLIAAFLSLKLRALAGFVSIIILLVAYCFVAWQVFVSSRLSLPVILPLFGSLLTTHVCMVTYRVIFEQNERRRVKAVFSKIVSPNVVSELLGSEKLSLGGTRREITCYFADVRGFTE